MIATIKENTMKLLILSLVLFFNIGYLHQTSAATPEKKPSITWSCNEEDAKAVDKIVARIMTYGRLDRKFPVNKPELRAYCKEQYSLVSQLDAYKNQCLKGRPKQLVSIVIYSIRALGVTYCRNPNSRKSKDLIGSASCANHATKDYLTCNNNYVDLLLALDEAEAKNGGGTPEANSKRALAQVCCGYVEIFKCIKAQGAKHSSGGCTETKVEKNADYIRGFFDNAVNVLCADYGESSDRCEKFKLVKLPKRYNKPKPVSYFGPLVRTLAKI